MPLRKATITFATTFALMISGMLGMSALVSSDVEAAKQTGGYGVSTTL